MTKAPDDVERKDDSSILFDPTLRIVFQRTILILAIILLSLGIKSAVTICRSSASSVGYWGTVKPANPKDLMISESGGKLFGCLTNNDILYTVAPFVTIVHHLTSAFKGDLRFNLLAITDLALLGAEFAVALWFVITNFHFNRNSNPNRLLGWTVTWIFLIVLFLFACLRITIAIKTKSPLNPVHYPMSTGTPDAEELTKTQILFGRAFWGDQILHEQGWLIGLRGFTTLLCIFAITAFAYTKIVLQPMAQLSTTSVKEIRMNSFPLILYSTGIDFNVIITHSSSTSRNLIDAVTVTKQFDSKEIICSGLPGGPSTSSLTFYCGKEFNAYSDQPLQIQVVVNYTVLLSHQTAVDGISNPVMLRVGLTNETADLMAQTPVVLLPGLNAIVQANLGIRQRYKAPAAFTFGLFNAWATYAVAEMAYIYNNPNNTLTALDGSVVRIYMPLGRSEITEYRITQDYADVSVLNGFAAAGGLWTFFGSIIALLFGRTIMQSITGSKPLSIFGLLHTASKNTIRKNYADEYPHLRSDLLVRKEKVGSEKVGSEKVGSEKVGSEEVGRGEAGLLHLIRDILLDLDMFESSKGGTGEQSKKEQSSSLAGPNSV